MFVAVAAHGVYLSKTVNSLSNIVLANVEALAFREDDSKGVGLLSEEPPYWQKLSATVFHPTEITYLFLI